MVATNRLLPHRFLRGRLHLQPLAPENPRAKAIGERGCKVSLRLDGLRLHRFIYEGVLAAHPLGELRHPLLISRGCTPTRSQLRHTLRLPNGGCTTALFRGEICQNATPLFCLLDAFAPPVGSAVLTWLCLVRERKEQRGAPLFDRNRGGELVARVGRDVGGRATMASGTSENGTEEGSWFQGWRFRGLGQ